MRWYMEADLRENMREISLFFCYFYSEKRVENSVNNVSFLLFLDA